MARRRIHIGMDRCFSELRWTILCLSMRGGPVTGKRLVSYGTRHFKVSRNFVERVIRKAIRKGIVKYVPSKNTYVLVPPRKSTQQNHASNGQFTSNGQVTSNG